MGAIIKEIQLSADRNSKLQTIYFGGGTPSILTVDEIASILAQIMKYYEVDVGAEITIEANPDDITYEKVCSWKSAGINRLSIGVQSFYDDDLKWMNRAHNAKQSTNALETALQCFKNITIDLIYGTPGLTNEKWHYNVQQAVDFGIPHLSCYALTVEPKTPLYKMIRGHKKSDIDVELQSQQFTLLMQWLGGAGYEHYEISNFAKPGSRSRHNSAYWKGKPYIGIGPSAHSYNGKERRWNISNNHQYITAINKGEIPYESEILTNFQQLNEYIMISLRTIEGLDLRKLDTENRNVLLITARRHMDRNHLFLHNEFLVLTDEGKLYADGIAADLFFLK